MITRVPYYYKEFKCIAGKCPDTCCAGWEIIIDEDTLGKYKSLINTPFGKELNSKITNYEDDGEPGFILNGNDCPFLNKNKLCDIYTNIGEDNLCYTCKTFPRVIEEYDNEREISISLSCPEAARLILKDTKDVTFVDMEGDFETEPFGINHELYKEALKCRDTAIDIIQDKSLDFNTRICLFLSFTNDLQDKIDLSAINGMEILRKKYINKDFQKEFISSLEEYKNKKNEKYNTLKDFFSIFDKLEQINEDWPNLIDFTKKTIFKDANFYSDSEDKFNEYYKDKMYEFEHILVYFTFRYFMKCTFDYELYGRMKLAVFSLIIIKNLDLASFINNDYKFTTDDNINLSHLYSKEVEHSDDNVDMLIHYFYDEDFFDLEHFYIIEN